MFLHSIAPCFQWTVTGPTGRNGPLVPDLATLESSHVAETVLIHRPYMAADHALVPLHKHERVIFKSVMQVRR